MLNLINKEEIFSEMMVHIPLCTHKDPKNVLIVGQSNDFLKKEVKKHCVNIEFINKEFLLNSKIKKDMDVIIFMDLMEEKLLKNIDIFLKEDGLMVFLSENFENNKDKLIKDLRLVGTKFWISMPFNMGSNTSILASKKYHPTADIILQRSDMLDDLQYYSTQIHLASFVFPSKIDKALTGIAKR